jgi:hypothetical protein
VTESISHEGYSDKAMHSYWDNFFVLKGFKDAAAIASVLGMKVNEAKEYDSLRAGVQNGPLQFHHARYEEPEDQLHSRLCGERGFRCHVHVDRAVPERGDEFRAAAGVQQYVR